jgi:hypothetical protein
MGVQRYAPDAELGGETGKQTRLLSRRRGLLITGIILGGANYLMFRLLIGGGHITTPMVALTLPALVLG